jgi:ADP-ribose pyrophosphatase
LKILDTEQLVLARYNEDGILEPLPENEAKWLKIFSCGWEHSDKKGRWMFTSRGEPLGPDEKTPDAVIVAAIHRPTPYSGQDNRLVLTSEYRVPIMGREIGFPAGLIDPGEAVEDAACREFKEETGLDLNVSYISPSTLYSSAGCTNETVQIVFGYASGEVSYEGNEGSEDIEVILSDYQAVSDLVESNVPVGAKAWPILFMLKQMWEEEQNICGFQL